MNVYLSKLLQRENKLICEEHKRKYNLVQRKDKCKDICRWIASQTDINGGIVGKYRALNSCFVLVRGSLIARIPDPITDWT